MCVNEMKRSLDNFTVWLLILCLAASCSTTKYLKEGEELYTGAELKFKTEKKIKNKGDLKGELEDVLKPKPNSSFLGFRYKLYLYNLSYRVKNKKIKNWLTKKGEAPVLFSQVQPQTIAEILQNRLFNHGFFKAKVDTNLIREKKTVKVRYLLNVTAPYTIKEVIFPSGNSDLEKGIRAARDSSLLKAGDNYDLDILKQERERIDSRLKNNGFFYFNPEYILFKADTTEGQHLVNIYVSVKKETPEESKKIYSIGDIYLYSDYTLEKDSAYKNGPFKLIKGIHYQLGDTAFKPKTILRSVFLKPGSTYNRNDHNMTLKRLNNLGTFKFVNMRFIEADTTSDKLNTFIYLTPLPKKSLRLELQAVSKSNNFVGPAFIASLRNRNFMKRAGQLTLNLNSGYETQIGAKTGFNSYEVGGEVKLSVPRFITPWPIGYESKLYLPKTNFSLGFRFLDRVQFYKINQISFNYGYAWRETSTKEHELNPISFSYVQLNKTTQAFEEVLKSNPVLQRSFEKQFIVGSNYTFTYNSIPKENQRDQYFFRGGIDVSGNLLYTLLYFLKDRKATPDQPYKFLSEPFSQYTRTDLEFRYNLKLDDPGNKSLASRIIVGVGLPYGNSATMPYIKQYFSGGPNSLRAFRTRSLGPGLYHAPDSLIGKRFLDQAGDMKLEGNLEYRFTIYKYFKGAVFTDAGNIWLMRRSEGLPGAEFDPSTFYKDIAIGSGVGLRFDISFIVVRLDLATPIRKPYLPEGQRWVVDQIKPGDPSWRKQNLVLNIAIGYPF